MALIEIADRLLNNDKLIEEAQLEVADIPADDTDAAEDFQPIGIGRPLVVEVQHIYSGDLPRQFPFGSPDLLVSSAAKGWHVIEASPRALNRLAKDVPRRSDVDFPAHGAGSRLAFYSPAVVADATTVSVELVADSFPEEAFDQASELLGKAAGLPVFASHSMYLLAGAVVAKAIGSLGEKLVDGRPFFSDTLHLPFRVPGRKIARARKVLLCNRGTEAEFEGKYRFAPDSYSIVDEAGKVYEGPAPYVSLSIDGREAEAYEKFAPAALTTELLNRFYHADKKNAVADALFSALEIYNDIEFAKKAKAAQLELAGLDEASKEYADKKKLVDAYLKNIRNDAIRKDASGET